MNLYTIQSHFVQLCHVIYQWFSWAFELHPSAPAGSVTAPQAGDIPKRDISERSGQELVALCIARGAKDDRPFRELFQRYQKIVWHTCYRHLGNPQDAEDLTQEVFFKVYRSLKQFKGESAFKTWLQRIAINASQNELRRRARRPQVDEAPIETMAESLPAGDTLEITWQTKAQQEQLTQSFRHLQPAEYEVLYLKDLEQRPYVEIAQMLNISTSAAKMRVQRARLAFQTAYRQLEG